MNRERLTPKGTIKTPSRTPPAASSVPTFTTTTTTTTGSITSWESDPQPVDPLETVEYESWMFLSTAYLALEHWDDLPSDVVRHAIVEDAVLHARSLCEVFIGSAEKDTISLRHLFPDLDRNIERYKLLREARKKLIAEYDKSNGKKQTYRELFNTRVMHPTVLRGGYGLYEKPLRDLRPKILVVIREIASLKKYPFRLCE